MREHTCRQTAFRPLRFLPAMLLILWAAGLFGMLSAQAGSAAFQWDGTAYLDAAGQRQPNLIVNYECVDNAYVNVNTGGVDVGFDNYFCTGFIPVSPGCTYRANLGRNHAWYNVEKAFLSGESGKAVQTGVTAPDGAAYIRFNINKADDRITSPDGLYFSSPETSKSPFSESLPWCYGMNINWIGDSIVAENDFDEKVCAALGLTETDYGINGSTIGLKADGTDGRNAICLRYDKMGDADIIAVSAGTNDFQYSWGEIGTIDSTENNTFYGALKNLCEGLITKYPRKIIFFTTPIKRAQPPYTSPFARNERGLTLKDYCDIIKEVCAYYSIPVLDLYAESLLNPQLSAQQELFDEAKTHPTVAGQSILARRVCGWLMQLGYTIP